MARSSTLSQPFAPAVAAGQVGGYCETAPRLIRCSGRTRWIGSSAFWRRSAASRERPRAIPCSPPISVRVVLVACEAAPPSAEVPSARSLHAPHSAIWLLECISRSAHRCHNRDPAAPSTGLRLAPALPHLVAYRHLAPRLTPCPSVAPVLVESARTSVSGASNLGTSRTVRVIVRVVHEREPEGSRPAPFSVESTPRRCGAPPGTKPAPPPEAFPVD